MNDTNRYDFDRVIDRRDTASDKWDRYEGRDVLPLWVADMDFAAPPAVLEALHARVDHGVFGYTNPPRELVEITCERIESDFGWRIEPDWMVWLPGVVPGLHIACRAVGEPGDAVISFVPVYPPFLAAPPRAERELVTVPLADAAGRIDFDALAAAVTTRTRLLMLSNPQNPTGRVYRRDELEQLAEFCLRNEIVLCSDEIHAELLLDPDCRHVAAATLDDEIARNTIALLAPSKTYNIAGLGCSLAVIPDPALRRRFRTVRAGFVPGVNTLGFTAALAAWRDCDDWRAALLDYLRANADAVGAAVAAHPQLSMERPEATYLAWLDARALGADDPEPLFEAAGLGLSNGRAFGQAGFMRLNFGCPRATLDEALARLARVGPDQDM